MFNIYVSYIPKIYLTYTWNTTSFHEYRCNHADAIMLDAPSHSCHEFGMNAAIDFVHQLNAKTKIVTARTEKKTLQPHFLRPRFEEP